eukprot:scaffold425742_cov32-Prasinocladus_malaysianus.AAC.1
MKTCCQFPDLSELLYYPVITLHNTELMAGLTPESEEAHSQEATHSSPPSKLTSCHDISLCVAIDCCNR